MTDQCPVCGESLTFHDLADRHVEQLCAEPEVAGSVVIVLTRHCAAASLSIPDHPTIMHAVAGVLRSEADKLDKDAEVVRGLQ